MNTIPIKSLGGFTAGKFGLRLILRTKDNHVHEFFWDDVSQKWNYVDLMSYIPNFDDHMKKLELKKFKLPTAKPNSEKTEDAQTEFSELSPRRSQQ